MICSSPGTSEKTARQIYWIDFQPGLTRNHHPDHPPNQNVVPSERSPVRWLKALLQQQLPNCCFRAAWAQSGHSEPLGYWIAWCILGILYTRESCHDFQETKRVFTEVFQVAPSFPSETCIRCHQVFPITPSFQAEWTAGKQPASAVPKVGVSHGIAWYHSWSLKGSLELLKLTWMWLTQRRKKNTPLHVMHAYKPHSTAMLLWMMIFAYTAWWVWKLLPAATVEWLSTLTILHYCWFRDSQSNGLRLGLKAQKKLKAWPGRHKPQNHVHHNFENQPVSHLKFVICCDVESRPIIQSDGWKYGGFTCVLFLHQILVINLTVTWSYTLKIN